MTHEDIARVCHEANRAYCLAVGDASQKTWDDAEEWQRASAVAGVKWRLANPDAPASAQHEAWVTDKVLDGWKHGPTKDPARKEHPCIVCYEDLPPEQRFKDSLFVAVVGSLMPSLVTA
jgi:hypothetical protein